MTQYNMKDLETAGLLKMDFLGLRTLSVMENALAMINKAEGVDIVLDRLPEDDQRTFELFARGDTVGVFQFESTGMQDWLRKLKPTCISDLVAMNALYRPGPREMIGDFISRKHGTAQVEYLHPKLEPILKETYGVIVYQEQVMKIASEIAGFSLAKADLMRRAMGKKDKNLMATLKEEFIQGSVQRGTTKKLAGDIFDLLEKFASYGFNKSHSVAYSVVAYQTAYLKAHYPAEFMAATLSSEIGNTDRIVKLIDDCRKMGIKVLPPDVNFSGLDFTVVEGNIRFGLSAIKNVGTGAVEAVIKARDEEGKFVNIFDFCRRLDLRIVNKKCLESLVQAGAFDGFAGHRAQQFENLERAAAFGVSVQSQDLNGQAGLFDSLDSSSTRAIAYPTLTEAEAWSEADKLQREKNVLGFYVSGHPLLKFEQEINEFANVRLGDISGFKNGSTARACGIVSSVKKKIDKRNNTMAFVAVEDFSGKGECVVFSDPYAKYQNLLVPDAMVMVIGKGEVNGDSLKIILNEAYPMEKVREKFTKSIILSINVRDVQENTIVQLRSLLEHNKGNCPCYISVTDMTSTKVFQSRKYAVDPSDQFVQEVTRMFGAKSVKFTGQLNGK
jgi:DNA polymerase-3 subunit alpha